MAAFSRPSGMVGMLLTVLVLLQTVTASHAHMHMHMVHRSPEAMDRRADNVVASGPADGTAYPRLEIRELQKNADQFNLYLLALQNLQAKDKKDPLSYYQISGIHGRPFVPWNEPGPLKNIAGYCPHRQVLFGTWHRPYLALYEQALYASAKDVISKFPSRDQQKWNAALTGFRMPYFDWAQEPTVSGEYVPKVIRDAQVSVTSPSGKITINNPLYSYSFGTSLPTEMGWGPQNGYPATLRMPSGTQSNNDAVNKAFGASRVGWRQRIYALFASKQPWGMVSSAQYGAATSRQNADSYEALHDEIHSTVGGVNGHMAYLDVAAFDPMFWLHHTNIDRLLSMHQIVTPDSWVASGPLDIGTAQWTAGELKDQNTPLKPFMKDTSGSYYTSTDVRETRVLGYFYGETENKDYNQVVAAINKLYGQGEKGMSPESGRSSSSSDKRSSPVASSSTKSASSSGANRSSGSTSKSSSSSGSSPTPKTSGSSSPQTTGAGNGATKPSGSPAKPTGSTGNGSIGNPTEPFPGRPFHDGDYDTVLSVVGDKFGMPGSCKVFCFLGNKPIASNSTGNGTLPSNNGTSTASPLPLTNSTSTDYYTHPDYVGSHTFLGGSVAKTNASSPALTEGSIPLTACLQGKVASGELQSLHPDHVEPYLKEHLYYKVIAPNGQELLPEKVPNFHAKVKSCPITPAPEGQLATYHDYIDLPRVNLPASAPWTPPPPPVQIPSSGSGTPGSSPIGTIQYPWDEPGYCVSKQVINYVDSNGKFLYSETH